MIQRKHIFAKKEILSVLVLLDREYKKASSGATKKDTQLMITYAKMAIIAISGWIEDGIKDLSFLSILKLKELPRQKILISLIEGIHGCSYNHFSKAIIISFGAHGFEFLEKNIGDSDLAIVKNFLGNLKKWRDDIAHSYVAKIPRDPSGIIKEISSIFPILRSIEQCIRKYRRENL